MPNHSFRKSLLRVGVAAATAGLLAAGLAGCSGAGSGGKVGVALIVKTTSNPYFVAMETAAKAAAAKDGVDLTLAAGQTDGDVPTQVAAIEAAIARGDKGILITPNGPGVNSAIAKARKAGLLVIALDTVPTPPSSVDITFATNNYAAGQAIGKWTAAKLDGKHADIAMLDLFNTQVVSVDLDRDHGFLNGMGITVPDANKNGSEASSGTYTGGKGGTYTIAGHQASMGDVPDGRTAMETILAKDPNVDVVYGINEPAAYGGYEAMKAAGKAKGVLFVAIDGGCTGVGQIKSGILDATAQQYPSKMASLGMAAIVKLAKTGKKPSTTPGLSFYNTGSKLITDQPQSGVPSVTAAQGLSTCWKN